MESPLNCFGCARDRSVVSRLGTDLCYPPAQRRSAISEGGGFAEWICRKGPRFWLLLDHSEANPRAVRHASYAIPNRFIGASYGRCDAVRVSLGGEYRILNPIPFVTASTDAFGAFYLKIRQALHAAVREVDSDAFLKGHSLVINRVRELPIPRAVQLGVEMTQLEVGRPPQWVGCVPFRSSALKSAFGNSVVFAPNGRDHLNVILENKVCIVSVFPRPKRL